MTQDNLRPKGKGRTWEIPLYGGSQWTMSEAGLQGGEGAETPEKRMDTSDTKKGVRPHRETEPTPFPMHPISNSETNHPVSRDYPHLKEKELPSSFSGKRNWKGKSRVESGSIKERADTGGGKGGSHPSLAFRLGKGHSRAAECCTRT